MDKIKEMFSNLPKWAWYAIGGAVLVVLYVARKRSQVTTVPTVSSLSQDQASGSLPNGSGSSANTTGVTQEQFSAYQSTIGNQLETALSAVGVAIQNTRNNTDTAIAQTQAAADLKITQLSSHVNEVNSALGNQNQSVLDFVKGSIATVTNTVDNLGKSIAANPMEPEHENKPMIITATKAVEYGGADYNTSSLAVQQKMVDDAARLKTDNAFRLSEIDRANQVIKDKKAKGEDTTAQTNYLKKLTG